MSYSSTTTNFGLRKWSNDADTFDNADLNANWDTIDTQLNAARPASSVSKGTTLPVSPVQGDIYFLTAANGGFPANSIVRYDGSAWRNCGPIELQASAPTASGSAHHNGRIVILTADDAPNGLSAWDVAVYNGTTAAWQKVGRGTDVVGAIPSSGNYNGRIVVLTSGATEATTGEVFSGYDVIRYNGSVWHKVGPASLPPEATATTSMGVVGAGKLGLIRAGSSPYTFMPVMYSGTNSRWNTAPQLVVSSMNFATSTSTVYTNYATTEQPIPWILWKDFDTANMKPQFRLVAELMSNNAGGTAYANMAAYTCNAGGASIGPNAFSSGEISVTGVTQQLKDSGWVDIPAGSATDFISVHAQIKTGNTSHTATVTNATIWIRWISKS